MSDQNRSSDVVGNKGEAPREHPLRRLQEVIGCRGYEYPAPGNNATLNGMSGFADSNS